MIRAGGLLRRASQEPALPIQVAVLREPEPAQDPIEQSYALETAMRTVDGATDITRSEVAWPDAERAVLVQWTQGVPTGAGESVATRYWQLNAQVSGTPILVVVGFAPVAEFDRCEVDDIVRTFRIRA